MAESYISVAIKVVKQRKRKKTEQIECGTSLMMLSQPPDVICISVIEHITLDCGRLQTTQAFNKPTSQKLDHFLNIKRF